MVGKTYEKIIDKDSELTFDRNQNGGQKLRGIVDNWMMLTAVMDEGKRLRKPVYSFFC